MKPSSKNFLKLLAVFVVAFVLGYLFSHYQNKSALAECRQQKTLLSRRIVTEVSNNIAMEDRLNRCLENSQ